MVKNILKYLKRIKDTLLVYGENSELIVRGYNDVSFHIDQDDFKFQF